MGSIGSGCVGIDQRGRLYNDILNPIYSGPLMPDSFAVVRTTYGQGEPFMRALCCGLEGERESISDFAPPYLKKEDYKQQILHPVLQCKSVENGSPVTLSWMFYSPITPYDHVASVFPGIILSVNVANPGNRPLLCSVMFCLNNLTTEADEDGASRPAQIHFIRVEPTQSDTRSHMGTSLFRGAIAEAQPELLKSYVRNALLFGDRRNTSANARPHLCLGVKEQLNAVVSRGIWDPQSPGSCEYFWKVFREKGVAAPPRPGTATRAGSVCGAARIAPGESHRFDFIFTWHIPPEICEAAGAANGYMQHFPNAPESLRYGLRNLDYLYKAVSNWHKYLTESKLPDAFIKYLIDSTRAYVSYSRHQKKNGFKLLTNVDGKGQDTGTWDFLRSFALLSFEPRFHAAAVTTALTEAQEVCREYVVASDIAFIRRCAEIVLSAYADILYMGNRARFRDWYPRTVSLLDAGIYYYLEKLAAAGETAADASIAITGVWSAALNAIALMGREQNDDKGVEKREPLRQALSAAYEKQLAKLAAAGRPGPLVDTLAGACYAELLNMAPLVPGNYVGSILAKNTLEAGGGTEETEEAHHNRMLCAVAEMLFSKHTIKQESGAMKGFLENVIENESIPTNTRAIMPNRLALWTVLHCLSGVYYDTLHHTLVLRPSFIAESDMTLPVFTPVSLGKMDVKIEKGQELIAVVRLALETPLAVESILLRLPVSMRSVRVSCIQGEETVTASQELLPGDGDTHVALRFRTPLKLADTLTLRLRETSAT